MSRSVRTPRQTARCTAFEGATRIASGALELVVRKVKRFLDRHPTASVLIFDDETSEIVEVDFRGTVGDVVGRLATATSSHGGAPAAPAPMPDTLRKPGRPRLGVVAREVTLLPRHWEWLNSQPGGASVALRRLVEDARRVRAGADRKRRSQEVAYRFLSAMAGDLPGFEEATRALFTSDRDRFITQTAGWPVDVRRHARMLADAVFDAASRDQS